MGIGSRDRRIFKVIGVDGRSGNWKEVQWCGNLEGLIIYVYFSFFLYIFLKHQADLLSVTENVKRTLLFGLPIYHLYTSFIMHSVFCLFNYFFLRLFMHLIFITSTKWTPCSFASIKNIRKSYHAVFDGLHCFLFPIFKSSSMTVFDITSFFLNLMNEYVHNILKDVFQVHEKDCFLPVENHIL